MDYAIYSDPVLFFAFVSAITLFLLNGVLISVAVYLRAASTYRTWHYTKLKNIWRPVLTAVATEPTVSEFPKLAMRHAPIVLRIWVHFQESLAGEAHQRLNEFARTIGLDKAAQRFLRSNDLLLRFIGITALGHLHEKKIWPMLEREIRNTNPYISLAAAQAMARIDAVNAVPRILPLARQRKDWPPSRVFLILKQLDNNELEEQLSNAITSNKEFPPPQFIRYLDALPTKAAMRVARGFLRPDAPVEVICACLELLRDPADVSIARDLLTHPAWQVRVQVAKSLGRVGHAEDVSRLVSLLSDKEWWVRFRAAEAITQLPFMTAAELSKIKMDQKDRYAVAMFDQWIAEHRTRLQSNTRNVIFDTAQGAA